MDRVPPRKRERYCRQMFGQALILARHLVEAGVPIVPANMGSMNNWDKHNENCKSLVDRLLPPLDRAVFAPLDDDTARRFARRTPCADARRIRSHADASRQSGHGEQCPRRPRSLVRRLLRYFAWVAAEGVLGQDPEVTDRQVGPLRLNSMRIDPSVILGKLVDGVAHVKSLRLGEQKKGRQRI